MLKVFLAEDEFIVREGIKKNVDWEGNGYQFVGEAADGELAFPMIQRLQPDIVITDIKMPFMDGLELSKLIKKNFPWIEIIILSGFAEFEYAKEAISVGVAYYLTKPISGAELLERIDELAEKIEEKKRERSLLEKYAKDMEENTGEEKKKLFMHICLGDKPVGELLDDAKKLDTDITASWYGTMLLEVVSTHHARTEYSGSVVQIYDKIKSIIEENGDIAFLRDTGDMVIILKADDMEDIEKRFGENEKKILEVLSEYPHVNFHGGCSLPVGRLTGIPDAFKQALTAYAHRFFSDKNAILSYKDAASIRVDESEGFDIKDIEPGLVS
ncbi:MAG: response regulator, partial [Lachnospiraceae bacterium]|nr:response regulator [Lachnospiraceae bacterium]